MLKCLPMYSLLCHLRSAYHCTQHNSKVMSCFGHDGIAACLSHVQKHSVLVYICAWYKDVRNAFDCKIANILIVLCWLVGEEGTCAAVSEVHNCIG